MLYVRNPRPTSLYMEERLEAIPLKSGTRKTGLYKKVKLSSFADMISYIRVHQNSTRELLKTNKFCNVAG